MRFLVVSSTVAALAAITACAPADRPLPTEQTGSAAAPAAEKVAGPKGPKAPRHFEARLSGAEEVPARDTRGKGHLHMELSKDGQSLKYELQVDHINNVIASHIHIAPVGVNGGVVVFLFGPANPGGGPAHGRLAKGTITAANLINAMAGHSVSDLVDSIAAGHAYANVHTNDGVGATNTGPGDFPGGEIRGQVSAKP